MAKTYIRIVVEEVSNKTEEIITRNVVKEKQIECPKSILDLGMSHREQIDLLEGVQDSVLKSQSTYLDDGIELCQECGSKLQKNGHIKSEFFAIFTDHKVPVQRRVCSNNDCGKRRVPSIYSIFGTRIHPELAKLQTEMSAKQTYRQAKDTLNKVSSGVRKINNNERLQKVVSAVGTAVTDEKNEEIDYGDAEKLTVQVDGGHIKDKDPKKRSFEVMTSVVYRPENVIKNDKSFRGEITNKHCAASALEDTQKTIKSHTLLACKKEGLSLKTEITAICDGAKNCWSIIDSLEGKCASIYRILDWFHISMKFENLSVSPELKTKIKRIKWHLWRGKPDRALTRIAQLIEATDSDKEKDKLHRLHTYISNNNAYIINYRDRMKNNLTFTSNIAESTVESLINQRCKGHQHMRWTREGVHPLLQIRAAISSKEWASNWKNYIIPALPNLAY